MTPKISDFGVLKKRGTDCAKIRGSYLYNVYTEKGGGKKIVDIIYVWPLISDFGI